MSRRLDYPESRDAGGYWIHKHGISLEYGGPEEGGWHYEHGWPADGPNVFGPFGDQGEASAACVGLNHYESDRRKEEEDYDFTSVLAHRSQHFAYSVQTHPDPFVYPAVRPHYE